MAATANKYSTDTLNDKSTTSGNTTTKNVYALQPLALTEYLTAADAGKSYSQMTAAEKKDDTGFKQKFFVHDVWHKKDSAGNEVVIGLLDPSITSGETAAYNTLHADARKGKLRIRKSNTNYTVLNDGGLNTKPYVSLTNGDANSPIAMATPDFIIFRMYYKNAYYNNTTYYKCTITATGQGTKTFTIQGTTNTAKHLEECYTYFANEISTMALTAGSTYTITLSATNGEGTYTAPVSSSYTLGQRETLWQVYKITNESDDTDDGTMYYIILDEDWYTPAGADEDKTLADLLASTENTTYTAEGTTICGQQGSNFTGDILTTKLPEGMYLFFPEDYIETPTQEDPPSYDRLIIWIDSNGHPCKWKTRPATPVVVPEATWASTNPIVLSISTSGTGTTSYAETDQNTGDRVAHIYPVVTVTCGTAGKAVLNIKCSVCDHSDHTDILYEQTKTLDVRFTSNNQSKTIDVVSDAGDETTSNLPWFELPFTPTQGIDRYDVVLEVTSADPTLQSYPSADGEIESDGTISTT